MAAPLPQGAPAVPGAAAGGAPISPSPFSGGGTPPPGGIPAGAGGGLPPGGLPKGPINPFIYDPSFPGNVAGTVGFLTVTFVIFYFFFKHKAWYFNTVPQAALMSTVALIARTHATLHPQVITAFVIQKMGFVIAPSILAIGIFMTFTRVVWLATPTDRLNFRNLWCPPKWISFSFGLWNLTSDGLKGVGTNVKGIGETLVIIGLVSQMICFLTFTIVSVRFILASEGWRVETERWIWRRLAVAISASTILLTGRASFLILEEADKTNFLGFFNTHEWPFWMYDAMPILAIYTIFCVVPPGSVLPRDFTRFKFNHKRILESRSNQPKPWPKNGPPQITHPHEYKGAEVMMTLSELELGGTRKQDLSKLYDHYEQVSAQRVGQQPASLYYPAPLWTVDGKPQMPPQQQYYAEQYSPDQKQQQRQSRLGQAI